MGNDIANESAEVRHGDMRSLIDSGNYKRSGMFVVKCRRNKTKKLGKSQIESFFFNALQRV